MKEKKGADDGGIEKGFRGLFDDGIRLYAMRANPPIMARVRLPRQVTTRVAEDERLLLDD